MYDMNGLYRLQEEKPSPLPEVGDLQRSSSRETGLSLSSVRPEKMELKS